MEQLRRRHAELWAEFLSRPPPQRDAELREELVRSYRAGVEAYKKLMAPRG